MHKSHLIALQIFKVELQLFETNEANNDVYLQFYQEILTKTSSCNTIPIVG